LPKISGGLTFNLLYQFVDAVLGIDLDQKMNVVGHDFQLDNLRLSLFCDLSNQTFETVFDGTDQYLSSVLWTPNNMVFARVDHVVVGSIAHRRQYTLQSYITLSKPSPYIPISKERGFTAT
jgi:hypothetical protein